jgi:hypothetical protein
MSLDPDDPRLPDSLLSEFSRVYRTDVPRVSPDVDRLITSGARAHLARRSRLRLFWSVAGTVAAAIVVVCVLPVARPVRNVTANAVDDVNGDGVVDIRDALALQQQLDRSALTKAYDLNGDGVTDRKDVDIIAQNAVRLPDGAVR